MRSAERNGTVAAATAHEVEAPGLAPSQRRLLERLKRLGAATIPGLAQAVGLNVETVRHHLRALEALGYVERRGTRSSGPGRPEVLYGLASAAERLFPRREGQVLQALATYLKETGNAALLHAFFEDYIGARRAEALARVAGLEGEARVAEVARILTELGFMATAEYGDAARLHLCHCPLRELVEVTKVPCRAELGFVRELLGGGELVRLGYIPAGDATCSYRTQAD